MRFHGPSHVHQVTSGLVLNCPLTPLLRSPVGVSTIRKIYGIRKSNGSSPSHWSKGAGGLARKALQSLEGLKLVEKDPNGGRRLTSQGRRDLDRIAAQIKAKSRVQVQCVAGGASRRWMFSDLHE